MKNFDTRAYSISDFIEWDKNGFLELSPDFQRRSVWSEKAKSYLIDTILNGKPMPKIIITQKLEGIKNKRVVVDGQQRLRAILEYYNGDFKLSGAHNRELSKYTYAALPDDLKRDFLKYELGVDLLFDVPYPEILDIFARINSYTVKLEPQEIFNARYLGYFKQTVYKLGFRYVNYFLEAGVITKAKVTRMAEAELAADLFVALLDKVQTNKSIENYYKKYEDHADNLPEIEKRFNHIMKFIGGIYKPEELKTTNFSRYHLFYSLFTSIGHLLYKLDGLDKKISKPITEKSLGKIRIVLDNISAKYDEYTEMDDASNIPKEYQDFITAARRGTTDTATRVLRANFISKKIAQGL